MPSIADFAAVLILARSVAFIGGRLCASRRAPRNDGPYSTAGATTNDSLNITGELAPARYVPSAAIFAGNQGPHRPHDVSRGGRPPAALPGPMRAYRGSIELRIGPCREIAEKKMSVGEIALRRTGFDRWCARVWQLHPLSRLLSHSGPDDRTLGWRLTQPK